MSYYARVSYTANGSTPTFSFSFPYISTSHVKAYVNGVEDTSITFPTSSSVTLSSTPSNGDTILIKRITSPSTRLVDFQDGSVLSASDLDQSANQNFYMAQETDDEVGSKLGTNANNVYDASATGSNLKISNVADPTSAQDVATKNYIENTWLSSANKTALTTVNANIANINAVNSNSSNINSAVSNATNINLVATNITSVNTVASDITKVVAVANDLAEAVSEVETVADDLNEATSEIDTVANNIANVNTVGGAITNINTVAGISSNITTVAGISANVTTVAGMSSDISTVNSNSTNINTVAGANTNIATVAGAVTNINTVASNISGVNSFADRYRISASAPSTSLDVGDLYFDTTANELKVYKSSGWASAGSTVNGTARRYTYNITGTPNSVSGADAKGETLAYDAGFVDVFLNGVRLSNSSGSYTGDVTVSSGTSVVFANNLANGDVVDIVAYGTFSASNIEASDITSGTINNARLPSTISDKTIEATALTAKGDGSSNAGKITLNCENNSHGVKIQSPAHSAAQSYTLILPTSVGTANQVLATNGSSTNQLSWIDATETKPTVANVSQTIAPATATDITITGTNFVSIPQVDFVNGSTGAVTRANTVSFTSATSLSVNCTLASGNYYVRIENPDGNAGRSTNNIITASTAPTFSTSAGSLGTIAGDFSGTVATIAGSSDSAITFSETTSVLTNASQANCSLNSTTGVITTSDFGGSSTTATTYNFTIQIQDAEGQTATRDFSLTSSFGATGGGQFN